MRLLRQSRRYLGDAILALLLLAAIVAVTSLYVSRERTFYSYDLGGYHNTAGGIAARYRESPAAAFRAIQESLGWEYNALFAVPLLPLLLAFDESRLTYELALAVAYLFPFALALGSLGARAFPERPRAARWGVVAVALLTPAFWTPTLRGYPDTGAATLIALAVAVAARDTRLRRWWQVPVVGALLAAAMIFRRHFAYAAVAFLLALTLLALARCAARVRREPGPAWRGLAADGARIGLAAATCLATLLAANPTFVARALSTDYRVLHASYMWPPAAMARWAASGYGWIAGVGAAAGFALAARDRALMPAARFAGLSGGLAILLWTLVVRQTDPHYTLHFTPFVVLGLAALGRAAWRRTRGRRRALLAAGFGGCLLANLAVGLGGLPAAGGGLVGSLFAAPSPPLARDDYAEVARLVAYLREIAPNRAPIYVAASSTTLNGDLIAQAERALYGRKAARLAVLPCPEIDSRDYLPLAPLLQSRYVVVVSPFQHHLAAEEQDVVRVVYDLFVTNQEFARDFAPLPARFTLANGAVATVYQRTAPTSRATAMRTLRLMRQAVRDRPGGQPDWLVLDQNGPLAVDANRTEGYRVTARPGRRDATTATALLHLESRAEPVRVSGAVHFRDRRCPGAVLRFSRFDRAGRATVTVEVPRDPTAAAAFTTVLPPGGGGGLVLEIVGVEGRGAAVDCTVSVERLTVVPTSGVVVEPPPREPPPLPSLDA